MEFEALWSSVKTYYFRYENVILRVPFCLFLQLGTYFDRIVKDSDEDTKSWYEIAAVISGLIGTIGLLTNLSYLQKCFIWFIEEVVLVVAFAAITMYGPSDAKKDNMRDNSSRETTSYLGGIYGYSLLYAQVFVAVSVAIAPRKWATASAKQTVGMFVVFPVIIQL
ncbi:hypothetical protein OS493_036302 [Desmophyllum pertusum]|uniref:Uncharacterized protein n=1 Tax=Desmophyllum pertusum TaxID=174260 RepID=A0A9W9Z6J3_9CNID|nr:hypothetical protein OS493_036302 [Desmophyllum pertusum]